MRFRKRICAFHLDGVLGSKNKEWLIQQVGLVAHRYLFSCIASSMALCVFGDALLISSARTILANTGPSSNLYCFFPPISSIIYVPVISEGIRSGVHCILLNLRSSAFEIVLMVSVLARPGLLSTSAWLLHRIAIIICSTASCWPTTTLPISSRSSLKILVELAYVSLLMY